ncbi:hypothetical protein F5Y15DRAFT_414933 [Xylariaceae sp. FL0016]|nr:hypothetical protein F5Y15DRAFT_414933 [Xylariaceae sp. FL0016]
MAPPGQAYIASPPGQPNQDPSMYIASPGHHPMAPPGQTYVASLGDYATAPPGQPNQEPSTHIASLGDFATAPPGQPNQEPSKHVASVPARSPLDKKRRRSSPEPPISRDSKTHPNEGIMAPPPHPSKKKKFIPSEPCSESLIDLCEVSSRPDGDPLEVAWITNFDDTTIKFQRNGRTHSANVLDFLPGGKWECHRPRDEAILYRPLELTQFYASYWGCLWYMADNMKQEARKNPDHRSFEVAASLSKYFYIRFHEQQMAALKLHYTLGQVGDLRDPFYVYRTEHVWPLYQKWTKRNKKQSLWDRIWRKEICRLPLEKENAYVQTT